MVDHYKTSNDFTFLDLRPDVKEEIVPLPGNICDPRTSHEQRRFAKRLKQGLARKHSKM